MTMRTLSLITRPFLSALGLILTGLVAATALAEVADSTPPPKHGYDWDARWAEAWAEADSDADAGSDTASPEDDHTLSIGFGISSGPRHRGGEMEFRYRDEGFKCVYLTGDFTDWQRRPMDRQGEEWTLTLALPAGRFYYRYETETEGADSTVAAIDPGNSEAKNLADKGWVSVLDVEASYADDDSFWDWDDDGDSHGDWRGVRRTRRELSFDQDFEDASVSYQRVDGLMIALLPEYITSRHFEPSAKGFVGYGFKSEDWSLGLTVLQPLVTRNRLWLKLDGWTGTDYTDQTGVGEIENSLAMAFFRSDYRDYYKREGATASLVTAALPWLRVEAGAGAHDFESLENKSNWSFKDGDFRPNPPIDEGTLRSAFARIHLGTERNHFEFAYETAGEDVLGGDFNFDRVLGEYAVALPLGWAQDLRLRVKGGANLDGELPRQRRFVLGGFGTVRGYPYQSLVVPAPNRDPDAPLYGGETMLLFNAEYLFDLNDDFFGLALLYDAGMAWEDRDADIKLSDLRDSAGVGLNFDEDLHLSVMRALDGAKRNPVFELRLSQTF